MNETQHDDLPEAPQLATEAGTAYFRAAAADFRLFHFIIDSVLAGDYVAYVAKRALAAEELPKGTTPAEIAKSAPGPRVTFLRKHRQLLLEMFLARLIDNFQRYLVDLVRAVLRSRPQMLSTKQQVVTLEEVLKYERMEDLVHAVIERRVNALSYEGFAELQTWCLERGLELRVPTATANGLVELIATRNVIAHNRGYVDERYLKAVPDSTLQVGCKRTMEVDDFLAAMNTLQAAVEGTDAAAAAKFGLPRCALEPEAGEEDLKSARGAEEGDEADER